MLCWMKQHTFSTRKDLFLPHCSKSQMKKHWKDILSGQLMWGLALQTLSWHSQLSSFCLEFWCILAFLRLFYVMMVTWNASSFAEGSRFQFFTTLRTFFSTFRALWTDSAPTGVRGKILYLHKLLDLILLKESWKMQLCVRNIAAFKKTGRTHAVLFCPYFGAGALFFLAVLLGSHEMDSHFHQRALQGCARGSSTQPPPPSSWFKPQLCILLTRIMSPLYFHGSDMVAAQ